MTTSGRSLLAIVNDILDFSKIEAGRLELEICSFELSPVIDGVAELMAPRAESVTCLDRSEKVLAAARKRLARCDNMRFELGDMHALPFDDASFDAVMLLNCLTYAERPAVVIREAARVLRSGGAMVGVTLKSHRHEKIVAAYNHVQLGFDPKKLERLLRRAGLAVDCCHVTSREQRAPHFEIVTFHASRP